MNSEKEIMKKQLPIGRDRDPFEWNSVSQRNVLEEQYNIVYLLAPNSCVELKQTAQGHQVG